MVKMIKISDQTYQRLKKLKEANENSYHHMTFDGAIRYLLDVKEGKTRVKES